MKVSEEQRRLLLARGLVWVEGTCSFIRLSEVAHVRIVGSNEPYNVQIIYKSGSKVMFHPRISIEIVLEALTYTGEKASERF